jgi:hypothetical protein
MRYDELQEKIYIPNTVYYKLELIQIPTILSINISSYDFRGILSILASKTSLSFLLVYFDFDMRIFNGSVTQAYLGIV